MVLPHAPLIKTLYTWPLYVSLAGVTVSCAPPGEVAWVIPAGLETFEKVPVIDPADCQV